MAHPLWIERVQLTNYRNYERLELTVGPGPVVLAGANGAGKTNLLEAVSLLGAGQGLRRAPFVELAKAGGDGAWSIAARAHSRLGPVDIGTGIASVTNRPASAIGRIVRIDGETIGGSGALADYIEMVWITPSMDGLFTGPGAERRRFLDRLILCFDPSYRTRAARFEKAMTSRNRLLADGVRNDAELKGFELVMAETGVAIAAARREAVTAMIGVIARRRGRDPGNPFPWSMVAIEGRLEDALERAPAVDVEDSYLKLLSDTRERDRAAGRTLEGPHRSDLAVSHGPKNIAARQCSTGEQKALLVGLVLAHAELVAERQDGSAPILLLDEITAHLDADRRAALFAEILRIGAQAWMTGTDVQAFAALENEARFYRVGDGGVAGPE